MTEPADLPEQSRTAAGPTIAPAPPAPPRTEPPAGDRRAEVRAGALVAAVLAVLGAVLGLVWEAWSPPGPAGAVLSAGIQPDETEAWVAGDGRFALITVVVGLAAGLVAWYLPRLRAVRGAWIVAGLAVGGVVGALLTELVGQTVRGDGSRYDCSAGTCIDHLPLSVHIHALWLTEAVVAVLAYGLCVAFAVADDLGRPDPGRRDPARPDPARPDPARPDPTAGQTGPDQPHQAYEPRQSSSVGAQGDLQHGRRHGDTAGPA